MRCDVCGRDAPAFVFWPGTQRVYSACLERCNSTLRERLLVHIENGLVGFEWPPGQDAVIVPEPDWWTKPHTDDSICVQIDKVVHVLSGRTCTTCTSGMAGDGTPCVSRGAEIAPVRNCPHWDGSEPVLQRCEICGEPTERSSTWPGRDYLWHTCTENWCDQRLATAIGARGSRIGGWMLPVNDPKNPDLCWAPPFDWFCYPHPADPICKRIDEEATKLHEQWRSHGTKVLHDPVDGWPGTKGAYRFVVHPIESGRVCAVCGRRSRKLSEHSFVTSDGRTLAYLCCGSCCHDVTSEWRKREPDANKTTMDGVAASIDVCTDRVMSRTARAKAGDPVATLALREMVDTQNGAMEKVVDHLLRKSARCSHCLRPVHSVAPSRDGNWYCEDCVRSMTALHEAQQATKHKKPEDPLPPVPGGRYYLLSGDLHGPKV